MNQQSSFLYKAIRKLYPDLTKSKAQDIALYYAKKHLDCFEEKVIHGLVNAYVRHSYTSYEQALPPREIRTGYRSIKAEFNNEALNVLATTLKKNKLPKEIQNPKAIEFEKKYGKCISSPNEILGKVMDSVIKNENPEC